ncbi:hypothetical protein BN2476_1140007 [Paraburkholderia piptadeniae]|uniref:Uncharacterized protein n=1 Tax=Paraburkholderia piptadeniae TaxID=1701573 RepID=A0A1N7SVB7_9BURK|nr:hypothetical protein BN2476_1140007 [Paraburkholderia piptadeniae]
MRPGARLEPLQVELTKRGRMILVKLRQSVGRGSLLKDAIVCYRARERPRLTANQRLAHRSKHP